MGKLGVRTVSVFAPDLVPVHDRHIGCITVFPAPAAELFLINVQRLRNQVRSPARSLQDPYERASAVLASAMEARSGDAAIALKGSDF
jgi:hypothetical protein